MRDGEGRRRLIQNIVAARFVFAVVAAVGAVVFAVVAGYDTELVVGTAIGAVGLVLTIVQLTYAIPLVAGLRLEMNAAIDLLRQAAPSPGSCCSSGSAPDCSPSSPFRFQWR